jgi:predicted O-methyltransferase YrrM
VILEPALTQYLTGLEPEPDPLLAEMRAHGDRDHIPIVEHVTGGLLEVLAASSGATRAVEVGTAIGVSTLHLARGGAHVTSFEVDPERHEQAQQYLARDGRAEQVDLRLQDAAEGLAELEAGAFDLGFIDGPKAGYSTYLDEIVGLLRPGGMLLADNVLMGGGAATGEATNQWSAESIAVIREFNAGLKARADLRVTFLPVGDGVALGVRLS